MKMIVLSLVLGAIGNTAELFGKPWPIGSVIAIVIMGVYIKKCIDKHFHDINARFDKFFSPSNTEKQSDHNSID